MWQKKRIEERVLDAGAGCFAYDYERVGHFGRCAWSWRCWRKGRPPEVVSRTERHQPCRRTFGRVSCPLGGRVTELVRFRNSIIIVCGRSRPALPTSPTMGPRKSPKQDRYCSPARFTSSSTCASFSSIFCHRAFTSILISWPS
jgi:hypothetical protein